MKLLSRLSEDLIRSIVLKPKRFLVGVTILCAISVASAFSIHLKTSNLDLISSTVPEVKEFLEFAERFGTPNMLVVVFQSKDPNVDKRRAVDAVSSELRNLNGVKRVIDHAPAAPSALNPFGKTYFQSKDGSTLFIFVQPENTRIDVNVIAPLVASIRDAVSRATKPYKGIEIGYTGIPQYALDDQEIIQSDLTLLSLASLVLIIIFFVVGFSSIWGPLYAIVTLLISVIITLGVIPWYPGYLTLLSSPFAMMLFGLGIDYGIHLAYYLEELNRQRPNSYRENIISAVLDLSRTLLSACATTVSVFLVLVISDFQGFRELGVIASYGMVICLICTFTVLPALLSLFPIPPPADNSSHHSRVSKWIVFSQKIHLAPLILLASVAALFLPSPTFDANYLNLQPKGSNAVRLERYITTESDYSPYYAAFTVDSLESAAELTKELRAKEVVGSVRSASDIPKEILPFIPKEEINFFNSNDGKYAVYAFPAKNIWDPEFEPRFISEMHSLNHPVTGMPFIGNVMMKKTKEALATASELSIILVILAIIIDFRNIILVILVALPPLLAMLWMQASMTLFNIPYNPLNIMALPIVIGTGVDYTIHIAHRFVKEKGNMKAVFNGVGVSLILTALTTLAGFGTLSFSSHLGLRSFGLVLSIGITAALLFSLIILPWCLSLTKRWTINSNF